ncbi:MAG: Yip1 family protein [Bacteroidales bacterium]|jgi:hypothetical protein|nr:Yip1 family protein [Bacteroidales bacterium]
MDFNSLINKVKDVIINPAQAWEDIKFDTEDKKEPLLKFAIPLIILGSFSTFIGSASFGLGHSAYIGFMSAIAYFISCIAGIYISAIVINELAMNFGSEKNLDKAFKLVIYSSSASFLATIVSSLHPMLSFVGLFALYSIYIFWLGVKPMMNTPEDKKLSFVVISALIIIAVIFLLNLIFTSILISSAIGSTVL